MALPNGFQPATRGQERRADFDLLRRIAKLEGMMPDGMWNGTPWRMGGYAIWVDTTGDLRIKFGEPVGDTDGTVIGTQS